MNREQKRVVASSYLGTTIEFYDFLLYATASALVFGPVFFTDLEPWAGVIASYGTFAAGYVARPLGGILFGHLGDKVGRKKLLVASMTIMGLASTAIGLIPSPALIGPWAAVLLVLMRVLQGIAVGGEWGGAALMALEHAEPRRRGFAAAFTNAGAPTGAVLGTLAMSGVGLLPDDQFLTWGWRVPFLLSFLLLIVGLWVRSRVSESPIFDAAMRRLDEKRRHERRAGASRRQTLPLMTVLRRPKLLILVILAATSAFAFQTSLATFSVTYAVTAGTDRSTVLLVFALANAVSVLVVLLSARVSDSVGRRTVLIVGNVTFIVIAFPMFMLMSSGNTWSVFFGFLLGNTVQSVMYGPLAAFIGERFGTTSRYTGASMGYQLATLIGAGLTPVILGQLYALGGDSVLPVVLYLAGSGAVSILAVLLLPESNRLSLDESSASEESASGGKVAAS